MERMKAISLWQPWATLIAIGEKTIETRSWYTKHRGLLAIHAGRQFPLECRSLCQDKPFRLALRRGGILVPDNLPLGAIVAVAELVECVRIGPGFDPGNERTFGDFRPGRYAWHLTNIWKPPVPISARGEAGLWEWELPYSLRGKFRGGHCSE